MASQQDPNTLRAQQLTAQANTATRWAAILQWGSCLLIIAAILVPIAICGGVYLLDQLGIWK